MKMRGKVRSESGKKHHHRKSVVERWFGQIRLERRQNLWRGFGKA